MIRNLVLLYIILLTSIVDVSKCYSCSLPNNNFRQDCFPQFGANQAGCLARRCCWAPPNKSNQSHFNDGSANVPYCYYPDDYPTYQINSVKPTPRGQQVLLIKLTKTYVPNEIRILLVDVIHETNSRVRVKISDPTKARFEVPIEIGKPDLNPPQNPEYDVIIPTSGLFSLEIKRKSDGISMFKTIGPLLYADQFIQISTLMATNLIYGIGEQNRPFLHNLTSEWSRLGLWARDNAIDVNINLYGTHPFYMAMPMNGKAFGTYFLNSNAQEFSLQPAPLITYRTIGGILDMFFFTGGTPEKTVSQYTDLIGKPMLPPFWSLGFHLCRYGYKDLKEISNVFERNINAGIPIATQWADIDYMDKYKDFTVDPDNFKGLGDFIASIRKEYGTRFVLIIDPGIYDQGSYPPYASGLAMDVYIKNPKTGAPLEGEVWPGKTVYPDFTHPNTDAWWAKQIEEFHSIAPIDGLWIDMNEPSNFVDGSTSGCVNNNTFDNPFFVPIIRDNSLIKKTICSSALHYKNIPHYNLHNLYGYTEAVSTNKALRGLKSNERVFILSRSTFSGSGVYTNHWTGDNFASWDQLAHSIRQVLNFNMFGIPMTGADICGFIDNTTEELCVRWTQLGAFYPFMRNHNTNDAADQDPAVWSLAARNIMKTAINTRYALLPYYYTLLAKSHLNGSTVFRPLSFEFYDDQATHAIDLQFMVGSALLVTPVVTNGARSVIGYFPTGVWYDFMDGHLITRSNVGGNVKLDAPLNKINIALRGGAIVPLLDPEMTLDRLRENNFTLYCGMSQNITATGDLYWDDGISLDSFSGRQYTYLTFAADNNGLNVIPRQIFYKNFPSLLRIVVFGLNRPSLTQVLVNGRSVHFTYQADGGFLLVDNLQVSMLSVVIVKWN